MFIDLVCKNNNEIESCMNFIYLGEERKFCEKYNLAYLGEFFERYKQTSLDPFVLVKSIGCAKDSIAKHDVFDGQLETFVEEMDELIKDSLDIKLKICYISFLSKMGLKEKSNNFLAELVKNMKMDLNFLIFTLAVSDEVIKCTLDNRKDIIKLLNEGTFEFNVTDILKNYCENMAEPIGLVAIRKIASTFSLKKKDFENENKFKAFKELKNFGTEKYEYEDSKELFNLTEQQFYILCIKAVFECYVDGKRQHELLYSFSDDLKLNLNINSHEYIYFGKLFRYLIKYGVYGRNLRDCFDFNDLKEDYYEEFYLACTTNILPVNCSEVSYIFYRESFMKFIERKRKCHSNIIHEVILNPTEDGDKKTEEFYLRFINEKNNLKDIELAAVLIERGKVRAEDLLEQFILEINNEKFIALNLSKGNIDLNFMEIKYAISKYKLKKCAYEICKALLNLGLKVTLKGSRCYDDSYFEDIALYANMYITNLEAADKDVKGMWKVLDDFYSMFLPSIYIKFLVLNSDSKGLLEDLEITLEELDEVMNYILDNKNTSTTLYKFIYNKGFGKNKIERVVNEYMKVLYKNIKSDNYTYMNELDNFNHECRNLNKQDEVSIHIEKWILSAFENRKEMYSLFFIMVSDLFNEDILNEIESLKIFRELLNANKKVKNYA